jgi:hypothetical protein
MCCQELQVDLGPVESTNLASAFLLLSIRLIVGGLPFLGSFSLVFPYCLSRLFRVLGIQSLIKLASKATHSNSTIPTLAYFTNDMILLVSKTRMSKSVRHSKVGRGRFQCCRHRVGGTVTSAARDDHEVGKLSAQQSREL